ncbi:FAD:protein FMN transferase [Bythopirellula polymerisocia]|nr:FAD:protein FMN transferase [Bythopirellula polymerisocia]
MSGCDRWPAVRAEEVRSQGNSAIAAVQGSTDAGEESQLVRVRVSQFHMGMMVHLTLWAPSVEEGQLAAAAAFDRIRQINQMMSDFEPGSELSRLSGHAGMGSVAVSPELFEVLQFARRLAELTDGLYDPTLGPVVRLWRKARESGQPPHATLLEKTRQLVDYQALLLDSNQQTAELMRPGMQLDLGSIAKGYAGDAALRILREQGIRSAAFEAGGDKVFGDPPPGEKGWMVETPQPEAKPMQLANCAVSISGDTAQFIQMNGRHISHVIDPNTGLGVSSRRMCITVAPRGLLSDPLATIGTILPQATYHALLKEHFPEVRSTIFPGTGDNFIEKPRIPSPTGPPQLHESRPKGR